MQETKRISIQSQHRASLPDPNPEKSWWQNSLNKMAGEKPDETWGGKMIRAASDMMIVCDQECKILYHNRAFLKGVGHTEGTYVGHSLIDFFPTSDKADALKALQTLLSGNSGGMRIEASILTCGQPRKIEARVTRARRRDDKFYLYFVMRDVSAREQKIKQLAKQSVDTVFAGLPIAAFRTDKKLNITHAFGAFWKELGVNPMHLKGAEMVEEKCQLTPEFLHGIDFCDVMAGHTIHAQVEWLGRNLEITIEPFVDLDSGGKVVGTMGIVREAKAALAETESSHLDFPDAEEFTQVHPIPRIFQPKTAVEASELDRIRSRIRPRPMKPLVRTATVAIALAN